MRLVARDEREAGVDLVADRLVLLVLSYGVLAIVAYRAFALREQAWDLMALLVGSGLVGLGYRLRQGVVSKGVGGLAVAATIIAAAVALVLVIGVAR